MLRSGNLEVALDGKLGAEIKDLPGHLLNEGRLEEEQSKNGL